jgi:hypothetical protein
MAQRESGYARIERDSYMTPAWPTEACLHEIMGQRLKQGMTVLEPAVGTGLMANALQRAGLRVITSDIVPQISAPNFTADFLDPTVDFGEFDAIFTNPPYKLADKFIRRALELTRPTGGLVAMLLGAKHDFGKTRSDIFRDCPAWGMRIVLLDRIWWFEPEVDANGNISGPSEDHCWYVWDWRGSFGRTTRYASAPESVHVELARKKKRLLDEYKSQVAEAA